MSRLRVVLALVAGLVVLGAVAGVRWSAARLHEIPPAELSQQLNGRPPLTNLVQDQGNSVTLPGGRTLWIFADTARLNGTPSFFVTSSAGVAEGRSLTLDYLTGPSGAPVEFLPRTADERADQVPEEHYTAVWPTGATTLPDGRIIISYAKYQVKLKPQPDFDFIAGGLYEYRPEPAATFEPRLDRSPQAATRIADDIWSASDGPVASPVYAGGQVYFMRCEDFVCWSLRTTPAQLADRSSYQWWTGSGWSPDQSQRAQVRFGSDVPGRNPSIAWSSQLKLFVIADTTGGIQAREGRLWVARNPQGPWSGAAGFPLPQCPADGCYTVNVHPDQSEPGTVRVSFATSGIGPYVRVVDVPIVVTDDATVPSIRTGSVS